MHLPKIKSFTFRCMRNMTNVIQKLGVIKKHYNSLHENQKKT